MDVEQRVAAALAAGDQRAAASEAIRGYGPRILGYLRSVLPDPDDAADAFQLFAENLWQGLAGFEGRCSVRTFAYKVAWTAAVRVRDEAWRRLGRPLRSSEASRLAQTIRAETDLDDERRRRRLEAVRAHLTEEEQTLLVLRLDQQLSWDEVAEVLARDGEPVQPATLRKRYERIKQRLAGLLRAGP